MRKTGAAVATVAFLLSGFSNSPGHAQTPTLGQVTLFGNNFCPRGWAETNGQLLPISSNSALFSLFGTNFGGDGRTTFGLPKLPKSQNNSMRYCVAIIGTYPSRN